MGGEGGRGEGKEGRRSMEGVEVRFSARVWPVIVRQSPCTRPGRRAGGKEGGKEGGREGGREGGQGARREGGREASTYTVF